MLMSETLNFINPCIKASSEQEHLRRLGSGAFCLLVLMKPITELCWAEIACWVMRYWQKYELIIHH